MNAGLTLYGLSRDGGKTWEAGPLSGFQAMMPEEVEAQEAREPDAAYKWVQVCTMAEALAARDMAEALVGLLKCPSLSLEDLELEDVEAIAKSEVALLKAGVSV